MDAVKIYFPFEKKTLLSIKAGQFVLLNGTIYTARDAAHERLVKELQAGRDLPLDLKNQVIYYVGPTPRRPGKIIGSAGPTTSYRMDNFVEPLLKYGLKGMIGKGPRSQNVINACKKYKAVYFITFGGCGALLSTCIKKAKKVVYPDLGCEAIFELELNNFPAVVGIDISGNSIK
ncbi:MAG: fumarate hydratase C-terminal domain-containing protein [Candidatus Firestonebacteria bacterium]|nr:fumarate hydratase C-terminal domain-containing protein [Candidatus Firestonebacteria bacterium]